MSIDLRRKRYAWLLLSVFLPMMLFSVLHTHHGERAAMADCQDCLHHVHHSHIVSATACLDHCVLCEFQTLPFLSTPSDFTFYAADAHTTPLVCATAAPVLHTAGILIPRAPPVRV